MILLHSGPHSGTEFLSHEHILWLTVGLIVAAGLAFAAQWHPDDAARRHSGPSWNDLLGGLAAAVRATGRLSLSALVVSAMFGLLSVPTTCACGTDIPHGHSLFELTGHHHHGPPVPAGDRAELAAGNRAETFSGPTVHSGGLSSTSNLPATLPRWTTQQPSTEISDHVLPEYIVAVNEHVDVPDPPPPRA